ncbi:hypothetical protein MKX01_008879 [Papaver californicum]|nr:hypothetical protein MKX01_008879 [Papaver californicum]
MKLFMSRHSFDDSPLLQAQKLKLIEDNISSFFPALKTRPTHPPYATMVMEAIKEMNEGGGSNVDEISKYIEINFQGLPFAHSHFLKHHLTKLVDSGEILYSYSNACYALPDLNCKPSPESEKKHAEQHHQHQQEEKRGRGRLRKKYAADEEGDGLVDSVDHRNSSEEISVVQTDSIHLRGNNNEDLMELGRKGEKHQRVDYSNIVFALEANPGQHQPVHHQRALIYYANIVIGLKANPLQQQRLTDGGRPSRIHVNQQETVQQHHQSACAKPVLETRKRRGRGRSWKIHAHHQETVEQQHRQEAIHAHQQEIVEQHHQNADSKPLVEIELEFLQEPCRGRPLGMQVQQETIEQRNLTRDSFTVVENEGGPSQQRPSKRRGRGRPRKEPVKQETLKHRTPIFENDTVVGIEVGPLHQSSEPQGVPYKKCEVEQSEMSESIPVFYAMENQPPRMALTKEGDIEQIHQVGIINQQHRNIDANLVVGTEVAHLQAEMSEKCETEHGEMIQTFYSDGNSLTSVNESPTMENQPLRMALTKEGDVEQIQQVGIIKQQHRNNNANLAVGTKVADLHAEINDECETEQAQNESVQTFYGDEDGLIVLGTVNSLTSTIDVLPLEYQPPSMHQNIDVNLAVGTEVAHLQAEMNEKCETEQSEMSESMQTFYGDENGLIFLGNDNSLASVIEALSLNCQPPWMALCEEGDTEQIHQQGTIEQMHRNTDVNLAVGTEIEHTQAQVEDKCETEQAQMSESVQMFYADEDGSILLGNGNSLTSVIEAPLMENHPPWMAVAKEGDTEQLHQQGILEQQHQNIDINLAVVIEIGHVQKEHQLNHRGRTTRTRKQSKTELEEKSESIKLCADDSTESGLAGEVFPDKRPKEVAFPDKKRKEVVSLQQQEPKRQLRPRPHEPYKGRLRRLKHTTYYLYEDNSLRAMQRCAKMQKDIVVLDAIQWPKVAYVGVSYS